MKKNCRLLYTKHTLMILFTKIRHATYLVSVLRGEVYKGGFRISEVIRGGTTVCFSNQDHKYETKWCIYY